MELTAASKFTYYEGSIVRTVWGQAAGAARWMQYTNRVSLGYAVLRDSAAAARVSAIVWLRCFRRKLMVLSGAFLTII